MSYKLKVTSAGPIVSYQSPHTSKRVMWLRACTTFKTQRTLALAVSAIYSHMIKLHLIGRGLSAHARSGRSAGPNNSVNRTQTRCAGCAGYLGRYA